MAPSVTVPFDFELSLRNDADFASRIVDAVKKCPKNDPLGDKKAASALFAVLEACKYNSSLILPYFFKYPEKDPMTLALHSPFYPMMQIGNLAKMVVIGGRQIAKSSCMAARQLLKMQLLAPYKITYLTPRYDQAQTFANRFRTIFTNYTYHDSVIDTNSRNALFYKEFLNDSSWLIAYALTNADRTRGRSTDDLDLDEVQDLDENYLPALEEMYRASKWKNVTYSGTAKSVDTTLEYLWQESSMAERCMPCHHCNHENYPTLAGNVMDMILKQGLSCVKCGKLLDISRAFWIHARPEHAELAPGFHIPQIILPFYASDPVQWLSIFIDKNRRDYHDFISENLGISTDTGAKEISETDLKACCTLGDDMKTLHINCNRRNYTHIISGMDWGGSDYQPMLKTKKSYTAHTVLGVRSPDDVDVLHFRKYAGMDYETIIGSIISDHHRLNGTHMASDFGAGQLYNWMLRKTIPTEMHFIFDYSSVIMRYIQTPKDQSLDNMIILNRTESISFLFHQIKKRHLHFPRWELCQDSLKDFLSIYRAPSEAAGGKRNFLYRKQGNRTDDFLHSVNFAYTLTRMIFGDLSLHPKELETNQPQGRSSLAPTPELEDVLYSQNEHPMGFSGDD